MQSKEGLFSNEFEHAPKVRLSHCVSKQRQTLLTKEAIQSCSKHLHPQKASKDLMWSPVHHLRATASKYGIFGVMTVVDYFEGVKDPLVLVVVSIS